MTLKDKMELIWNKTPCLFPCNLIRWSPYYPVKGLSKWMNVLNYLWARKGKLTMPRTGIRRRPRPFI